MEIKLHQRFHQRRESVLRLFLQDIPQGPHGCGYDMPNCPDYDLWFPNLNNDAGKWHNDLVDNEAYIHEYCDDKKYHNSTRTKKRIVFVYDKSLKEHQFLGIYQPVDEEPDGTPVYRYEDGFWYKRVAQIIENTDTYLNWKEPPVAFFDVLKELIEKKCGNLATDSAKAAAIGVERESYSQYGHGRIPNETTIKTIIAKLNLSEADQTKLYRAAGIYK